MFTWRWKKNVKNYQKCGSKVIKATFAKQFPFSPEAVTFENKSISPFSLLSVSAWWGFFKIKFYGVPAGHLVRRDSRERGEYQVLHTLSSYYNQTVLDFCPILPSMYPPARKTTGWQPNSCMFSSFTHVQLNLSSSKWISSLYFCEMESVALHNTQRTHFAEPTHEHNHTKLKWRGCCQF